MRTRWRGEGLTREDYDALMAERTRPLTQPPIRRRTESHMNTTSPAPTSAWLWPARAWPWPA